MGRLATRRALEQSLLYSEELGIDLAAGSDDACFGRFLAGVLFGARISETTAKNTYRSFARHGLTRPNKIIDAGWDFLVYPVMREGGYVRYDGRKSTQILRDCEALVADYGSKLRRVHEAAHDARDLEQRILGFYGVGLVTTNIDALRSEKLDLCACGGRSHPATAGDIDMAPIVRRNRRARCRSLTSRTTNVRKMDDYVADTSIPFSTHLMNPLATWPVTSIRCSRIASELPKPPRSLLVQPVIRCARIRKSSAVRMHRR
jgi:hypothetical protein